MMLMTTMMMALTLAACEHDQSTYIVSSNHTNLARQALFFYPISK